MKKLIVNADDFGYGRGVNRGIIEAFQKGIVTSATLLVNKPAAQEAAKLARENPGLGVGLHFEVFEEDRKILQEFKKAEVMMAIERTKRELLDQVEKFRKLVGRIPTHIDSHYHIHKLPRVLPIVLEVAQRYKLPIRGVGRVKFIMDFYGKPKIKNIRVDFLEMVLKNLSTGVFELMCHPGYVTADLKSSYNQHREIELATLTDPRIKNVIEKEGIQLINYKDFQNLYFAGDK